MALSELFDGWVHYLTPGEDFTVPAWSVVDHFEEDEDEALQPYEQPTPMPVFVDRPTRYTGDAPVGSEEESAWGGITLALGSLSEIVGGRRKSYQENVYGPNGAIATRKYSFQFIPGETGFQEGRL